MSLALLPIKHFLRTMPRGRFGCLDFAGQSDAFPRVRRIMQQFMIQVTHAEILLKYEIRSIGEIPLQGYFKKMSDLFSRLVFQQAPSLPMRLLARRKHVAKINLIICKILLQHRVQ